jgi:hypothetical protein
MPEEYQMRGQVSEVTDSFSFSVVLLELLTGHTHAKVLELFFDDRVGAADLCEAVLTARPARWSHCALRTPQAHPHRHQQLHPN